MRLSGAGFLWTSLFMMGIVTSLQLKNRVRILNKTLLMLNQFKTEIEFLSLSLPEMLKKISKSELFSELDYILICCKNIDKFQDFPSAWCNAIENSKLPYNRHEKEKLRQLSFVLGTTDTLSQSKILEMYIAYFKRFCDEAIEKEKKYANLAVICGMFAGCLVFVFLI